MFENEPFPLGLVLTEIVLSSARMHFIFPIKTLCVKKLEISKNAISVTLFLPLLNPHLDNITLKIKNRFKSMIS